MKKYHTAGRQFFFFERKILFLMIFTYLEFYTAKVFLANYFNTIIANYILEKTLFQTLSNYSPSK